MVNAYLLTGKIPLTPLTTETLPRPSQKKIITVHVMYTHPPTVNLFGTIFLQIIRWG
mgnify:CR=1 FL=1